MHVYPLDAKTKEGNLFWSLPKKPPTKQVFDPKNEFHVAMVASMACLRAKIFKLKIPSDKPRSAEFKAELAAKASKIEVAAFKADEQAAKAIQGEVDKNASKEEKKEEEKDKEETVNIDEVQELKVKFAQLVTKLKGVKFEDLIQSEEFEKDEDSNFHIDFMHALGNCRSLNYKLEPMDWI